MIHAVLVFNNYGKPRLSKFYAHLSASRQQRILSETFQLVSSKADDGCNFVESSNLVGADCKLMFRHFTTLYFVFCCDSAESELAILDLIQVFVEALDKCFRNVCELDLIFHPDRALFLLDEVVMGGVVLDTDICEITTRYDEQQRMVTRENRITPNISLPSLPSLPDLAERLRDFSTIPDLPGTLREFGGLCQERRTLRRLPRPQL